jgi:hypothetical protein
VGGDGAVKKPQTSEGDDVSEKTKFNQEDFLRSVDSFYGNLKRAYRTGWVCSRWKELFAII